MRLIGLLALLALLAVTGFLTATLLYATVRLLIPV